MRVFPLPRRPPIQSIILLGRLQSLVDPNKRSSPYRSILPLGPTDYCLCALQWLRHHTTNTDGEEALLCSVQGGETTPLRLTEGPPPSYNDWWYRNSLRLANRLLSNGFPLVVLSSCQRA